MVNQHSRLDYLQNKGMEIVQHCLRDESTRGDDALDVTLANGLYEIRQTSQDDVEAATTNGLNIKMPIPVLMKSPDAVPPTSWWLTRQHLGCVENSYTIVPNESGLPSALTTIDIDQKVFVKSIFPVWVVRCDEKIIYRGPDGKTVTEEYFRIIESGTDKCWKSNGDSEQVIISQISAGPGGRPNRAELFVFMPAFSPST